MKKQYILIPILSLVVALSGCQKDDPGSGSGELRLLPDVPRMTTLTSRAAGDSFFQAGQPIDVNIRASDQAQPVLYNYVYQSSGIFTGNPAFRFSLDDTYISTLTATWPGGNIRALGIRPDQRTEEVFRQSDWMVATSSASGIMPTDKPVPLNFIRENCMIEFELTGQNGIGVDILELTIELHVEGQPTAFLAWCDPEDGHAKLIVEPGTVISAPDKYMIGIVRASPNTQYTMIFPETNLEFKKGYRYLVTLSPQGYNMSIYAVIQGWNDSTEGGIGIPFQQPVPLENGSFLVDTPRRLVTMSYLMRHYTDGTTFNWPAADYVIPAALTVPQAIADEYITIPTDLFTGTMKDLDGNSVATVPITEGGEITLVQVPVTNP